jgi:hypothetical protein
MKRISIWINRAVAIAIGCAGLAACTDFGLPNLGPRNMGVLKGDVTISPPEDYCLAPKASTQSDDTAVVLMGRCLAGSNVPAAIVTASIGAARSADVLTEGPVALTRFFTSESGRAMLASSGAAKDVAVMAVEQNDNAVFLHIKDRQMGQYWRGIFAIKGRLVMLSVTGIDAQSLAPGASREILGRALIAMKRANLAKPSMAG